MLFYILFILNAVMAAIQLFITPWLTLMHLIVMVLMVIAKHLMED